MPCKDAARVTYLHWFLASRLGIVSKSDPIDADLNGNRFISSHQTIGLLLCYHMMASPSKQLPTVFHCLVDLEKNPCIRIFSIKQQWYLLTKIFNCFIQRSDVCLHNVQIPFEFIQSWIVIFFFRCNFFNFKKKKNQMTPHKTRSHCSDTNLLYSRSRV